MTKPFDIKPTNIFIVVFLYIFTGGVGGIIWLLVLAQKVAPYSRRTEILSTYAKVFFLLYSAILFFLIFYGNYFNQEPPFGLFFITIFSLAIIGYVVLCFLASHVGDVVRRLEYENNVKILCSKKMVLLLTIFGFLSSIYLQLHINRLRYHTTL